MRYELTMHSDKLDSETADDGLHYVSVKKEHTE